MVPQKQAEAAIDTEQDDDQREEERVDESMCSFKSLVWHGGSVYDAWFNCASNQVAQVLLTLPYSFSQLGMVSGVILQVFYGILGSWTAYLISVLYLEYRTRKEKENGCFKNHVIQWFEVLDGLLGPYWKAVGLGFNCTLLLFGSVIQLIACASNIYYINDNLDKRTWTYIFGACCATTVFIPSYHNYRIWSFLGLGMTTYTAWYLTIASFVHGQVEGVNHSGPKKLVLYFTGATNILYTFGGHAITVEIIHAMWKPKKFKYIYLFATLYVFTLTIPSASAVYWAFGDQLLNHSNAFSLLPRTRFRDVAVILMLIHQFITFGFACTPLYFVWEKVIGMHDTKSICLRALVRLPVVIPIWFLAIIFPFFGPINSAVGALLVSFAVYIIPSLAHMFTYRKASARQDGDNVEVASGSPLPGVKPQQLDELIRIPKETIEILRDQVFGFDTFFVTSQEPYEGGLLFKGNLRGQAARSYEKIMKRMEDKFGDQYKLFLLINPEDDKPVAVVVPKKTLQPETTAVPEWFAAGAFGLVTVFTLLLRNVPALQSNLPSTFDNLGLLKDGLPGAIVTALILGVHEISHILVAKDAGVKLGVPYFVPSWQIGSFGAITRIVNIVPKREDLLKVAAAGPLAGFSLGLVLLLLGFILPPSDGIGLVIDASVFHESFLAGGIAKLLLGDVLKEGTPISVNPLVIWAWAGLLINAINSIPAGELDGGRISFAIWGRKASARLTAASIALLGISSLFNDVAFYWVALIFFLQRGPIAPLSEEITNPDNKYVSLGIVVLILGVLVCLPYPFPFTSEAITSF